MGFAELQTATLDAQERRGQKCTNARSRVRVVERPSLGVPLELGLER